MSTSDPGPEPVPQPGDGLYGELLWVHGALRADLAKVRELADAAGDGAPAATIAAGIGELRANGPLWQLKMGCLAHCRFVHQHHRLEDIALFPALRRANPELQPVLEKLIADHRSIGGRVEAVEAAAAALGDGGDEEAASGARERVAAELEALGSELLEHLSYEEAKIAATMRTMTSI